MQTQLTTSRLADILLEKCVKPFGRNAVLDFDIPTMAHDILRLSEEYKVESLLCVAQGIVESHFACNPQARRSRKTKNIFNVGNVDDGSNKYFLSYAAGLERYFQLMDKEYRWPEDKGGYVRMSTMAKRDFNRPIGGRYATAPNYTKQVQAVYNQLQRAI
jgi:flagellum-specific peptidoglycan hydrolase FlgJ